MRPAGTTGTAGGRLRSVTATTWSAGLLAERYLRAVAAQDWATVEASLAPDVIRHGPYGDDFDRRGPYVAYLQRTMPALPGYRLDVDRVTEVGDGRVFVELRETVDIDGVPLVTPECLVFEVADGAVARLAIYLRQERAAGAAGGGMP
jgi:ketosteroid isomerase-like protein